MTAFKIRKILYFILGIAIGVFVVYTIVVKQGYQLPTIGVAAEGYLDSALPSKNEAIYQHHLNHRISPNAFQRGYVEQSLSSLREDSHQQLKQSLPSVHEDSYRQQLKQSLPSVHEDSYQQQLKQSLPSVYEDSHKQLLPQSLPSVHGDSHQRLLKQPLPSVHEDSYKQLLQQSLPSVHEYSLQRLLKQPLPNVHEYSRQQQLKRLQHLQRVCSDENVFKNVMYKKQSRIVYYSSFKYNFSYCKVHKAGGTFWTQVFTILRKGASEDVFNLPRDDVHLTLGKSEERAFKIDAGHLSRTVLVSRDPYSRLFSAFIDKLFLPINYPLAVAIVQRQRKNNSSCANNLTFEEFLIDIITSVREGKKIDVHWTPIVNLCKPCGVKAFAVVKQETFTADIEYVLKEVGIANDEFKRIYDALHYHRIEATIPGIVATTISRWKENGVEKCMGRIDLARRLWTAFQIQGFIRDGMPFPQKAIKTEEKAENPEFLTKVILETIKKNHMSPNEANLQRRRALVKAFDGLNKYILNQVKELYKQDFILFDYSSKPPSIKH